MNNSRPIFRRKALNHYVRGRDKAVLPQFVSPRAFVSLWILFGLLSAAGALAGLARVPEYASGTAFLIVNRAETDRHEQSGGEPSRFLAVVVVSPRELDRLRVGQTCFLATGLSNARVTAHIVKVEPTVLAPEAVRARFNLSEMSTTTITRPSAVVTAEFEPSPDGAAQSDFIGGACRADVVIGSRRLISLLLVAFGGPLRMVTPL